MIVVSDTSPINYLIKVGEIKLLKQLFKEVFIPPAVYNELKALPLNNSILSMAMGEGWLHTQLPTQELPEHFKEDLDEGEAEALALAIEISASLVLIDERRAAAVARKLGLRSFGLIGILIEAKEQGCITAIKPLLDHIRTKGFYPQRTFLQTNFTANQ
jgi:predicted nucleic acid-binding protein